MADAICKPFELTDGVYTLRDAICFTQEEWAQVTDEQLTALQQQRWDAWYAAINAPQPDPEPTPIDPPIQE